MVAWVAVQQQLRLFRDGLSRLLDAQDDIEVVGVTRTADELLVLCKERAPHAAVVDVDVREWDVACVATALRRASPSINIVGLADRALRPADFGRAYRFGINSLVCRTDGVSEILDAIRNDRHLRPMRARSAKAPPRLRLPGPSAEPRLTEREVAVLSLVGAGYTSKEISHRLAISHKTVENHKQRMFRKLGAQNQAHAVRIALQAGLVRPDRVIDLAASD